MGYTQQQKNKISKYYYRMNKACNQQNITKISNYFDHLKYHVMIGGTTTEEVNKTISDISEIITKISDSPEVQGIAEYKTLTEALKNNDDNILSAVESLNNKDNNLIQAAAENLAAILKQLKGQGGKDSEIYKQLEAQKLEVDKQLAETNTKLSAAEQEKTTAVDGALTGINTSLAGIQTNLQNLMTTLGITPTSVANP